MGQFCVNCKEKEIIAKSLCKQCHYDKWYLTHKEQRRIAKQRWRDRHPEYSREYQQNWQNNHPGYRKNSYDNWYQDNKPKRVALDNKRRAAKLQATPKWLTKEHYQEIEQFYVKSNRLTTETGIQHVVDHIIPLQGKEVSGLHVPWNLRVITAKANLKKYNKLLKEEGTE